MLLNMKKIISGNNDYNGRSKTIIQFYLICKSLGVIKIDRKEKLLLCKEVDWSLFNDGIILPYELNHIFGQANLWRDLKNSKSRTVKIILDKNMYCAKIAPMFNKNEDESGIRFKLICSENHNLISKLKSLFKYTYNAYLSKKKRKVQNRLSITSIKKEYICG